MVIPSRELESVGAYNMTCCFGTSFRTHSDNRIFYTELYLHHRAVLQPRTDCSLLVDCSSATASLSSIVGLTDLTFHA